MQGNATDVCQLLIDLLRFFDEADANETKLKELSKEKLDEIYQHDKTQRNRLEAERAEGIIRTEQNLEDIKERIDNLIKQLNNLDSKLEFADAHYQRARDRRSKELAGMLDEDYLQSTDVLDALERMQNDYEWLTQQLPNLKPGLLDDIHCLVSKKRQAVYDRLIILINTAAALKEEAYRSGDSIKNDLVKEIEGDFSKSLKALDDATSRGVTETNEKLGQIADAYTQQLSNRLREIFTDEVLDCFKRNEEAYQKSRETGCVDASQTGIVTLSHINVSVGAYSSSKRVRDCIEHILPECMANETLVIPIAEYLDTHPIKIFYAPGQAEECTKAIRNYIYDYSGATEPGSFACLVCDPRRNVRALLPHDSDANMVDRFFEVDDRRLYGTLDDLCVYERNRSRGKGLLEADLRVDEFPTCIRNMIVVLCDCSFDREGVSTASLLKSLTDARGDLNVSVVVALTEKTGSADFISYADKSSKDFIGFINELVTDRQDWEFKDGVPHLFGMPVSLASAPTPREYRSRVEQRSLWLRRANHTGLFALACVARLIEAPDKQSAETELRQQLKLISSVGSNTPSQAKEDPFVIGTVEVALEIFAATPCESVVHEYERTASSGNLSLPIRISRVGRASTLIAFQQDARNDEFLTNITKAWLAQTPLEQAHVAVLDPYWQGYAVNGLYKLADICPDLFDGGIGENDDDCEAKLGHILDLLSQRRDAARRACNGDIPSQPILLVASNYPDAYTHQAASAMDMIVRMGEECGISIVLGMAPENAGYAPRGATTVNVDQTGAFTPYGMNEVGCKTIDIDENSLIDVLRDENDRRTQEPEAAPQAPIAFEEPEIPLEDGSHGLSVPVGVDDTGNIVALQIGRDFSHMIITGTTGSGKSVFLHNLIESLCTHYAPSAVDLWLADFKKVEFSMYTDEEHRYPQVSLVGIDASEDFIRAFADHLVRELNRRQDLINTVPVANSISTYNANVEPERRLPRLVAIVDEFHHMSDLMKYDADIREQFDLVLREGRALGMHVIVADQTVGGLAGLSETAFSLMGGRVLLKWKDRREVPDMLGLPADELEHLRKGEGYLQADSGVNPIRFRGRFIAFGDIPNHEAQVRSRLDGPQRPLMSYDSTKRPIFDWAEDRRCTPGFVALGKAPNFENPVFGFKVRNSKRENLFILDKVQTMGHEIAAKFAWDLWRATGTRTIVLGSPHGSEEKSVWDTISSRGANVEFAVTVEDICKTLEQADNFENTTLVFDHFLDSIEDYQELPARQTETEDKTPQTSGRTILSGLSATTMNLFAELGMDAPTSPQGSSCQPGNAEEQATWDIRPAVFELLQKGGQRDVHICFIEESTPSLFKAFGDCGATYSDDIPTLFKHRIATQCARDESMVLNMGTAASSIQRPERLVKACYCDSDDRISMFIPYQMKG